MHAPELPDSRAAATTGPTLGLAAELGIVVGGQSEHQMVVKARNDIAHGRVPAGLQAIRALMLAERFLDAIAERPALGD